jgi:excisionase family DNA binding protein
MQNEAVSPSAFVSISEAAAMLGLSRSKIYQMCDSGELPSSQIGGRGKILISREAISAALKPTRGTFLQQMTQAAQL